MRDQYALSSNETVNIIAVGDFHIGSSEFNYDFIDYLLVLTFLFACMILGFTIILIVGLCL